MSSLAAGIRLSFVVSVAALASACSTTGSGSVAPRIMPTAQPTLIEQPVAQPVVQRPVEAEPAAELAYNELGDPVKMYSALTDGGHQIAAVDVSKMNPAHIRQVVDYPSNEKPGTIIVDQGARRLYLVQPGGKAIRYAIGVGPAARGFQGGEAVIAYKGSWPRWRPTDSMIKRNPAQYKKFEDGVKGGPSNPLGARALYMHKDGVDTYYRVHGTNKPSSIGKGVSAGCIRLLNQDIIDLHSRVKSGAKIVVK